MFTVTQGAPPQGARDYGEQLWGHSSCPRPTKVPPALGCSPGDTVTHLSPVPTPFPAACASYEAQPSEEPQLLST